MPELKSILIEDSGQSRKSTFQEIELVILYLGKRDNRSEIINHQKYISGDEIKIFH